jgi:hypothetical protein
VERIAEKEIERITAKCRRYQEQDKQIPSWVRAGMDERFRRVEQIEQRVQMLLGIFASHGVLPLEFKPAYSVGDLLLQHLDALEQEAEEKGMCSKSSPVTSPRSIRSDCRWRALHKD